ncbi:oxidoreductase [Patiriisocius marinistellae]|uniref:Oxidoreductase n=1 Tax=Patiriisocius marinistellae TaxID=2494560 RepID=A0A5J4G1J8_9FLAO|nr:FAD-dependent oxidoreductase [Patiriisocius marinistellae]GEQ85881.1 oxidoreductase [Patiriisocius marinistellae]
MDLRSNEPFWLIKNAMDTSYPSLTEDVSSQIVIIGGGITGSLIAYQLLLKKYNVILIEKRDVFNGSSAASTAMLQYEVDVPLHELIEQCGLTLAVSSYKACEKAIFTLYDLSKEIKSNCNFELKNSIYFTTNKRDVEYLKTEFKIRKEHGFDVLWLENKELTALGIKDGLAGIKSKSGGCMDPYKFTQDLLKVCVKKGLQIYDRTEIDTINQTNEKLTLKTKDGKKITTEHVVHCTGYESSYTLKENIVKLKSTYALASETLKSIPKSFKDNLFWDTSKPYLYFRNTQDGRIIMGGGDENFKNAKARDGLLEKKSKNLSKQFNETFPDIPFITDYNWAGTFGETKDGLPYMGKPDATKNEHYILGFGGNGITFSIMGMEAIVASIENTPHPFLEYYKFGR